MVTLGFLCFIAEGYSLAVYGVVLPRLMIGGPGEAALGTPIATSEGGVIGAYFVLGVTVGALFAGTIGELIGRRTMIIIAIVWLSLGMALTALSATVVTFSIWRFLAGLGVGLLAGSIGALLAEFAPLRSRTMAVAFAYAGLPAGALVAAVFAIGILPDIAAPTVSQRLAHQILFLAGALPLITVLPVAIAVMPASIIRLVARGKMDKARHVSWRTGVRLPMVSAAWPVVQFVPPPGWPSPPPGWIPPPNWSPDPWWPAPPEGWQFWSRTPATTSRQDQGGWARLFGAHLLPTLVIGLAASTCFLLTTGLHTWMPRILLPVLGSSFSLFFVAVLNGSALLSAILSSLVANKLGAKWVIATLALGGLVTTGLLGYLLSGVTFPTAFQVMRGGTTDVGVGLALVVMLLTAVTGAATVGILPLIFALCATYYPAHVSIQGMIWASLGRWAGVIGTIGGGILLAAFANSLHMFFYVLAGFGLLLVTWALLLPHPHGKSAQRPR